MAACSGIVGASVASTLGLSASFTRFSEASLVLSNVLLRSIVLYAATLVASSVGVEDSLDFLIYSASKTAASKASLSARAVA